MIIKAGTRGQAVCPLWLTSFSMRIMGGVSAGLSTVSATQPSWDLNFLLIATEPTM